MIYYFFPGKHGLTNGGKFSAISGLSRTFGKYNPDMGKDVELGIR
jgi:hypothetical protein